MLNRAHAPSGRTVGCENSQCVLHQPQKAEACKNCLSVDPNISAGCNCLLPEPPGKSGDLSEIYTPDDSRINPAVCRKMVILWKTYFAKTSLSQ